MITYAGISSARARFGRLSEGLRLAASGEVLARAVAKVSEQIEAVVRARLSAHELSGTAARETQVTVSGAMIQIRGMPSRNAKNAQGRSYVSLYRWWPFSRGMPPFVVKRASLIFARELLNVLGVKADNTEAAELVGAADAAEVAKVEKRAAAMSKPRRRRG